MPGLVRLESLVLLVAALVLYAHIGAGWGRFALCSWRPTSASSASPAGRAPGAIAYDAVHSLAGPLALALAGLALPALLPWALVWIAHIAADRVLGYGLR